MAKLVNQGDFHKQDPSAVVIPFGKHKGATVAELLAKDPDYVQWLMGQGWLAQRFAELHAAILTRGAAHDDTPEHNQLQARFLDPLFQAAFLLAAGAIAQQHQTQCDSLLRQWHAGYAADLEQRYLNARNDPHRSKYEDLPAMAEQAAKARQDAAKAPHAWLHVAVSFEQGGIDVSLEPYWCYDDQGKPHTPHYVEDWPYIERISVELKPTLGDDYPTVMRQIRRLQCKYVVLGQYTGVGTSFENVRRMFTANQAAIITLQEIEAELPAARSIPMMG